MQQIHILLELLFIALLLLLLTQLLSAAWRGQTLLSKCKARANKKLSPSCRLDQQQGWSGGLAAAQLMFSAGTPQGSVVCAAPGAREKNLHFPLKISRSACCSWQGSALPPRLPAPLLGSALLFSLP